jgi:hypothetical protein
MATADTSGRPLVAAPQEKGFWIKSRSLSPIKFKVPVAGLEPARPFRVNGF